jgi:hypothetical protein
MAQFIKIAINLFMSVQNESIFNTISEDVCCLHMMENATVLDQDKKTICLIIRQI